MRHLYAMGLASLSFVIVAQAADFTFNGANNSSYTAPGGWLGPVAGPPGEFDNVVANSNNNTVNLVGDLKIHNFTSNLAGWIITAAANTNTKLTVTGTLAADVGLVFRGRSGTGLVSLDLNTVTVGNGAQLSLGAASSERPLQGLNVSQGVQLTNGSVEISSSTDYNLGLLSFIGSGTKAVVLARTEIFSNRQATVSGLSSAVGSSGAVLSGIGSLNTGTASLVINNSADYTTNVILQNTISSGGVLSVRKQGAGTQRLEGASTYTGGTVVAAGTLLVNNQGLTGGTGVGAVEVQSGAKLGGGGTIVALGSSNVTVAGTLTPGDDGAGTLTFAFLSSLPVDPAPPQAGTGKLIFSAGSALEFTLGSVSDQIAFTVAGDWLSGSGNVSLNLTLGEGFSYDESYVIFSGVTTADFSLAGITGYDSSLYTAIFSQAGADYVVSFAAVPEPSTWALLAGTLPLAFWLIRRRAQAARVA